MCKIDLIIIRKKNNTTIDFWNFDPSSYPYIDPSSNRSFIPCYIHLTHGGYCTAIVFNGIDSVFITACFHISAQFQILTQQIQNIFEEVDSKTVINAKQNYKIRCELIKSVAKQVKIMEVVILFVRVFKWIILIHFISVAVIIGIGSINLLLVSQNKFNAFVCKLHF